MKGQFQQFCDALNRRQFIMKASMGLGAVALNSMAQALPVSAQSSLHFPARELVNYFALRDRMP